MVYNKSDFKKHIETIKVNGFKIKSAIQAYLYEQKKNDRIETITISYRSYAPHGFYVDGVSASIYFNAVEEIIDPLLEKYQIKGQYGNTTIRKSFVRLTNVDYSKFQLEINNEASFNTVAEEIKQILNFGVMPFFEQYNSLLQVADLLAGKKPEEVVPYIQGPILFPKTILILKLTKHSSFMNKLKEYYDVLVIQSEKHEVYMQMLAIYKDLFFEDIKEFCSV